MFLRTYPDYITLPCKASLVITNVWTRLPYPYTIRDRRRCHAELVAYEVHPLMGISTSGTILSSLFPYTSGSIKSPIPRWASRWLRLQRRPRAHQSEPASAGESISVSPLALLSCTHPQRLYRETEFRKIRHRKEICGRYYPSYGRRMAA